MGGKRGPILGVCFFLPPSCISQHLISQAAKGMLVPARAAMAGLSDRAFSSVLPSSAGMTVGVGVPGLAWEEVSVTPP